MDTEHKMNLVSSSFTHFVGNTAVVMTIFQFLSAVLVCKQYVLNKTTGEASALPFLFCLLSCALWALYGNLIHDDIVVFVNIVGVIFMMGFVVVFYKYSMKKKNVLRQVMGCAVFGFILWGYATTEHDYDRQTRVVGFIASFSTVLMVAAPFVKLFYVIKVKSTECLPFQMILMTFFVSLIWMLYGYLNQDIFIIVPNFICSLLALSQLSLFVIYPRTRVLNSASPSKTTLA